MKYIVFILLLLVGCYQLVFLGDQLSYKKIIDTDRAIAGGQAHDPADYKVMEHHESAKLQVTAKSLADLFLLTNRSGNVLSLACKVAAVFFFGMFLYKFKGLRDPDISFQKLSYVVIFLCIAWALQYLGFMYTRNWFVENHFPNGYLPDHSDVYDLFIFLPMIVVFKYFLASNRQIAQV